MAAAGTAGAGEDLNSNSNSDSAQSYMNFPLLRNRQDELGGSRSRNNGRGETTSLAVLLGRVTGRRGASVMVRETAARQLEERRADWGYSKPVVALDVMWNLLFVIVSVVMLLCTLHEKPNSPVRVWICGYAFQCFVHVVLVWLEYRRRISSGNSSRVGARRVGLDEESLVGGTLRNDDEIDNEEDDGRTGTSRRSVAKRIESVNTMVSFLWWIVGFYWVVSGGDILFQNAPRLYWLSVVFLAFDVIFAIFCVVLACLIGIALCCCLPCIIAILYAVYGQEGASDTDLSTLPKYRFHSCKDEEKFCAGTGRMIPIETTSVYLANERLLLPEDAECCICLSSYEDGVELHALPCTHHFHAACIVKWLKMKAWCPLCKYDILKGVNESV